MKHTILFLAGKDDHGALAREHAAIQRELRMTPAQDDLELCSRWDLTVDRLMQHLNELQPAVLHFCRRGTVSADTGVDDLSRERPRNVSASSDDGPSFDSVNDQALANLIVSAASPTRLVNPASSARLVVLNGCFSPAVPDLLYGVFDCVVGIDRAAGEAVAHSFAVALYRALGNRRSVENAFDQAIATLVAKQLPAKLAVCSPRKGLRADQIYLTQAGSPEQIDGRPRKGLRADRIYLTQAGSSEQIDFTAERACHERFVGRTALLARLDELLIGKRAHRWVVVTGGPGMGKTALLAAWLARREAAGATVPHHFIHRGHLADAAKLVGSLVAQLARQFPNQREPEAEVHIHAAARLDAMLTRVSANELVPHGERLVVLIDGLDEYDPPEQSIAEPLAAFLPRVLPPGVSVLCTSRPRHPHLDDLVGARGALQLDLDNKREFAADNDATVRAFWEQRAPELGLDAQFVARAVDRAGGNIQHAAMLHAAILHLRLRDLAPDRHLVDEIPSGLTALLATTWGRIAKDSRVVDCLGILCAAREPLTLDELGLVAGWREEAQRRAFLRDAGEWLVESRRPDGMSEYRLHHDSIRAHIAAVIGADALRNYHRALAHQLASWPPSAGAAARRYALRHALKHRAEAGEWEDAWRVAADSTFLETKCCELGAYDVVSDVVDTAEHYHATGAHGLRGFQDLARGLGREAHWLRSAPEATTALVWNQLRRMGWSSDDLDRELQIPLQSQSARQRRYPLQHQTPPQPHAPTTGFLRVRWVAARESLALDRNLIGHTGRVRGCAVTPDGQRVISASEDKTLVVWDLASGHLEATLRGHGGGVIACAVTRDGRRVVSVSEDKTLIMWDLASGQPVATLPGHASGVIAYTITPDGRYAVSSLQDRRLEVWDLASRSVVATLEGHAGSVTACAVTSDGQRMVSGADDGTLRLWDLGAGRASCRSLLGHTGRVTACAVTPDDLQVVSASEDGTVTVRYLDPGGAVTTLRGHGAWVTACAVTPDGGRVVSASLDRTLKIWDLVGWRPVATLHGHTRGVRACTVTPDGRRAVSASEDGTLKVWNLDAGEPVAAPEGHAGAVTACAVTPDGRRAVSAADDRTLKVWDLISGQPVKTLRAAASRVTACAVTQDGQHDRADHRRQRRSAQRPRRVVSASQNGTVDVWTLDDGERVEVRSGKARALAACAITPDGRRVAVAAPNRGLQVWDVESEARVAKLQDHLQGVTACAVSADGRYVASASWDDTLRVRHIEAKCAVKLHVRASGVTACAVTADGRVVAASYDGLLRVWDPESPSAPAVLPGHTGDLTACAVTPDGQRAISASSDKTLRVWDLASRTCLFTHRGNAVYFALAATAHVIVAGDAAGSVWVLDWPPSSALPAPGVAPIGVEAPDR